MARLEKRFPIYNKLLGLYPHSYRNMYGEQTLQTLADMLDNAAERKQRFNVWARLAADFPISVAKQQVI